MRKRFCTTLFFELLFQVSPQLSPLAALQTYPLVDQHKTDVAVSKESPNRIAVKGDRIHQIFGAAGTFEVQSDEETGQIFVKCVSVARAKPVTLTLITESGLTHDVTLIPQAIDFQSIVFDPTLPSAAQEHKPRVPRKSTDLSRTPRSHAAIYLCGCAGGGSWIHAQKCRDNPPGSFGSRLGPA